MSLSYTESLDREVGYYMVDEALTLGEMAARLGITANSLRWKRQGKQEWKWREVLKLSELTGKGIDELIGRKED